VKLALLALLLVVSAVAAPECDLPQLKPKVPFEHGFHDGLYWEKFPAQGKARGSVFFLAGGPQGHLLFHGADGSPLYLGNVFDDYDLYMYDYRGFNCSQAGGKSFTLDEFARDFLSLKNELAGASTKVILFGGSFGGMLGSHLLSHFPESIEKAILFSSDVNADFFYQAMGRIENVILPRLMAEHKGFEDDWGKFLDQVRHGEVSLFPGKPQQIALSVPLLESYLWMAAQRVGHLAEAPGQDSFPLAVRAWLKGDAGPLEKIHAFAAAESAPVKPQPPPTTQSTVLPRFVCTSLFPRSTRLELGARPLAFGPLSTRGIVALWNRMCHDYDGFAESPLAIAPPAKPLPIPVLFWIGERDWFDPQGAVSRLRSFTSRLEAHVMKDWAHDFGRDSLGSGMRTVREMIRGFLTADRGRPPAG
jgi:pimeloyl-ACP methyl ester carboxylesterase